MNRRLPQHNKPAGLYLTGSNRINWGWHVWDRGRKAGSDESRKNLTVATPVRVYPGTPKEAHGVIVEDFGDSAGHPVEVGGHQIVGAARRWAVQLADGSLVFVDDADVAAK
jgi:hypothetical protein